MRLQTNSHTIAATSATFLDILTFVKMGRRTCTRTKIEREMLGKSRFIFLINNLLILRLRSSIYSQRTLSTHSF